MSFDFIFVSKNLANIGVNGIAYSGMCTNGITLLVSLAIVWRKLVSDSIRTYMSQEANIFKSISGFLTKRYH